MAGERRAEGHSDGGDLVLGLHRADAEVLVLGELVENVRGWSDRVGAERDRQLGELTAGDDAPGQRRVAGDTRVLTRRQVGRTNFETVSDRLGGLAEVVAGEERRPVGGRDLLVATEPALDPLQRRVGWPGVHPRNETEGEEVLRSFGVTRLDTEGHRGFLGEARHRHPDHPIGVEAAVVERVGGRVALTVVTGLEQVALFERVRR